MSTSLLWTLVGLGFAIVVVRRRSVALALLAAQSLLLGALAIHAAAAGASALLVPAVVLLARGIALPGLLALVVARTREPRRLAGECFVLGRLVLALGVVLAAVALSRPVGLAHPGTVRAALALVPLGIAIAALRRPVVFQAIGFLVAENGVYLAGLALPGGLPGVIELGLVLDLVVIVAVAAAFGVKIHQQHGSTDSSLLETLRD